MSRARPAENDVWFVGFTNDVTVAVWIGYDNADGKRRTLGAGSTGGGVAVPIFEPVIQAVWANVVPKAALAPPSSEAKRHLTCKSVELDTDEAQNRRGRASSECFRIDAKGKVRDTQYVLVSRESASSKKTRAMENVPLARRVSARTPSTTEIPREDNGTRDGRMDSHGHPNGERCSREGIQGFL